MLFGARAGLNAECKGLPLCRRSWQRPEKIQEASSKDLTVLCYKGKRCLLALGREQDFSAVNIFIFPGILLRGLYKTAPPTQHAAGFVAAEAEWFVQLLQAAKMSWVSLFPKIPCGGSWEAPWKLVIYTCSGIQNTRLLKVLQADI